MSDRMLQPFFSDEIVQWPFSNISLMKSMSSGSSGLSVWEEEDEIVVEAALPGIKSDQVNIVFEKGLLTIQGSKKEEKEDVKKKYYHKADATFQYSLKVPGDIDEHREPIASLKEGLLRVSFKKHKRSAPRRIQIQE